MLSSQGLRPRDVMKLALQYQETDVIPYHVELSGEQFDALDAYFGGRQWRQKLVAYINWLSGPDNFFAFAGFKDQPDGSTRDIFGCSWQMGSTHHLVDWPLHEDKLGDYRLPDLEGYFQQHLRPRWPDEISNTADQFRIIGHSYGLFERAWSLRGFENFMADIAVNEKFAEELLEAITQWMLRSIDLLAATPADAIMLTDDHAYQKGMLMGADRWRRLFKPRWRRIYERIHHYGFYTIMHMCGDTGEVVPDLIEIGLDVMESCQPECMDLVALKRSFGRDIRLWGGLGAQSVLPFGTPAQVRDETRRLKEVLGAGGGYILGPAKPPGKEVPIANIAAFVEEAALPCS